MYTKQEIIIRYVREGKSQRQICRELQISRKTIKKYIDSYYTKQKQGEEGEENLHEYLSEVPKYTCPKRPKHALTTEAQEQIDQLLADNARKRTSGLHKQVLKKCDILTVLHQKGYKIGYTTVCNYISKKERRSSEAFIRQRYTPGSVCEFDWGEVKINVNGKRTVLQMAIFTSGYSNYRYACLFYRQDTLAFMESHVKFFAHTGGVYH